MNIIDPSYEILTDISPFGTCELEQIERAARTCYKSEDRMLDQAESAKPLIRSLIQRGHEAMLEHSSLTVKFICDRGISHELVRHRLASFAQESTRWCNYSKRGGLTFIRPLIFKQEDMDPDKVYKDGRKYGEPFPDGFTCEERACWYWAYICRAAEEAYDYMTKVFGYSPDYARSVLPNCLKTEVVVTANYREWRHILKLRTASDAHPEMRRLMVPLLNELKERIPVIFDDIEGKSA